MVPQLHLRRSERCSMQLSSGFGTSKTCLDSIDSIGASMRSALQLEQAVGIWLITSSGSTLWARCLPSVPGCLPCFLPNARRALRLGLSGVEFRPKRSDDGDKDEFDELRPSLFSNSAIFVVNTSTCLARVVFCNRSESISKRRASFSLRNESTSPWSSIRDLCGSSAMDNS